MRAWSAGALVAAAIATWGASAGATPEFPGVVLKALALPAVTIDPPQGCTLCHATDEGGKALRPFGNLMQQYGVQSYQDGTLEAALGRLQGEHPELVEDIKAGRDPNQDMGATNTHTPEYGCAVARIGADGSRGRGAGIVLFLAGAVLSARGARRRRRRGAMT